MPRTPRATTKRPAKQTGQAEREIIVTLRLPRELHARLKELGGERGLTAQIRDRLDASLAIEEAWDDPLFADLLRAVGYVVVNAALLYPTDPDAYSIVQLAIRMLLDAFRPDTAPDIVHEVYIPSSVQMLAKVERLLGVALGALGDRGIAKAVNLPTLNIATVDYEGAIVTPIPAVALRDALRARMTADRPVPPQSAAISRRRVEAADRPVPPQSADEGKKP